jgi:hypothetical protein
MRVCFQYPNSEVEFFKLSSHFGKLHYRNSFISSRVCLELELKDDGHHFLFELLKSNLERVLFRGDFTNLFGRFELFLIIKF